MWKTSDGILQERVIDPVTGLTRTLSVTIKGSGLKAEQEATRKLQDKIAHIADKRIKLSEAIELFIKESEKTKKASTARRYRFELKAFYDVVGECYLDTVTAGYIRKKLMDSGKSNRTLNGYLKVFKTFWMWAYRTDIVKGREVMDKLVNFQDIPEKERIQDKYLETWELKKLLSEMDERWRLVSRFLCLTGMRIGELIALERCDVWGSVIRINKTYDNNNRIITPPKSFDSKREIHVQPELRECIEEINDFVKDMKEKAGFESDLFFPDFNGDYLPYPSYSKYLRELSENVLGRRVTPHIFRHTHTSFLAAAGVPLDTIAARLGHSDSKITKEIYLHRTAELKEKENKQLDGITLIG
jgi:integrase